VVLSLAFIRLAPPPGRGTTAGLWASVHDGGRAAAGEPACRAAIEIIALVALLASPFIALVPAVARHLTHGGERAVASATAVLTTAQGVGAVVGALALAPLAARVGRGRALVASLALLPPVLILYGWAPGLTTAAMAMGLVGLVYIGVLSGLSTVVQLRAPAAYRGRVLSLYLVALGVVYPIGSLIQGPLADRVGLAWTTGGSAALLAVALTAIRIGRPAVLGVLGEPAALEVAGLAKVGTSPAGTDGNCSISR